MCDYNYDVLVVDDIPTAAEDYAKLISAKLGLKTIFTTDPLEAEEIVKNSDLKVVILDQVMPVKGTDLLPKLKKINPQLKSLMLTGQASNEEIGSAINLGFDGFLDKNNITEIDSKVRRLFVEYESSFAMQVSKQKPLALKTLFKWPVPRRIYILSKNTITTSYIDDSKKETIYEIFAGQEKDKIKQVSEVKEIETDETNEESVCADLKISLHDLGSLKTRIANSTSIKTKIIQQISETTTVKYKLPQSVEGSVDHRIIECSPVYEVCKIVLGIRQLFDEEMKRSCLFMRKFTGKHHIVQTDYNHDGTVKRTDLGIHTLAE